MTTTIVTTPSSVFQITDTTTGDTITVANGPAESGFQTTQVTTAGTTYILANQAIIDISGNNDGDNVILDSPTPSTGLEDLGIVQLGGTGTINGSSSNTSATTPDITVPTLLLDAFGGIGTNRALQTQVAAITAVAGLGAAAANLSIDNGVSAPTSLNVTQLSATNTAGGSVQLTNAGTVNITTGSAGIIATNNITLTTTNNGDLDVGSGAQITSNKGSIATGTFISGDLNLGDGNGTGSLQAAAGITLGITHNVTIDADAKVTNTTSGNISIVAGGNFTMLESPGSLGNAPEILDSASTGTIQLNAGPGGTLTLDSTGATAVQSTNGAITLTGDGIVINKAINSGTARTTLSNASAGQQITLGGSNSPGVLGLTQAELNRITAGVVQVGSNTAGNITIAAPLTNLAGSNTLSLVTGGNVSQSFFGSLTASGLAVDAGGSVALTNSKNDVTIIAASTVGAFSLAEAPGDELVTGIEDGNTGISTQNAPISLTADAIALASGLNAGNQTVTLTPATASDQIELGTSNAAGVLGITDTELGIISAAALILEAGGNISIAGTVTHHANLGNMQFITGGAITQSASLTVADLSLESAGGITLNTAGNAIGMLAFYNESGAVSIIDTGQLVIGDVDYLSPSANLGTTTTIQTTGSIFFSVGLSSAGQASLVSTAGGIFDNDGDAVVDVTAPAILLEASTGIGLASDPLEVQGGVLEALTSTGGIFIANGSAAAVTLSLDSFNVSGASGDILLTNNGTIDSTTLGQVMQGPGNVTVKATGGSADINLSGQTTAFSILGGSGLVDVEAGRDINLGGSLNNSEGAIGSLTGSIKLVARRNFTINANANVQIEGGSGGITATAGGAFTMVTSAGNQPNAPIFLTDGAGATIALAAGAGQLMTINSTGQYAVETNNGNITLTADAMFIDAGVNAGTGNVQYQTTTTGLQIGLGTAEIGGLMLDDADLNNATAKTLTVGNTTAGQVTVSGAINPTNVKNLTLESGAGISLNNATVNIGTGTLLLEFGQSGGAIADLTGATITAGAVDVTGGNGNDTVFVGSGTETLNGGGGSNTLDLIDATQEAVVDIPASEAFIGGITDSVTNFTNVIGPNNAALVVAPSLTANGTLIALDSASNNTVSFYEATHPVIVDLPSQMAFNGSVTDTLIDFANVNGSPDGMAIAPSNTASGTLTGSGIASNNTISFYEATHGVVVDLPSGTATNGSVTDTIGDFANVVGSPDAVTIAPSNTASGTLTGLGAAGGNTLTFNEASQAVIVDLPAGIAVNGGVTDHVIDIANVTGSTHGMTVAPMNTASANLIGEGSAASNTISFYEAPQAVTINLQTGSATNGGITDTLTDIANAIGSSFNDTITFSSTLNDMVTGNGGSDTFIFNQQFENDTITDFTPASGLIEFSHLDFANFAAVQAAATQQGANVVITSQAPGGSVTLDNIQLNALHSSNFSFV